MYTASLVTVGYLLIKYSGQDINAKTRSTIQSCHHKIAPDPLKFHPPHDKTRQD